MKLSDIRKIAARIKDATEEYETPARPLKGGCIWTSRDLAGTVQQIIHDCLPHLDARSVTICMGNYYSQGCPAFPEALCNRELAALTTINVDVANAPYHTWLEFDGTIIDLTFLYTTLEKRNWREMEAQPIYCTAEDGFLPYKITLEYDCLTRFDLSGRRITDKEIDMLATSDDVSEKKLNFLRRIEEHRLHWSNSILRRIFRRLQ